MRVALIGEGTRGDVAPLCHLAAKIRERGHVVRVVSRPDFAACAPPGAEFRAVGPPIQDFTSRHAGAFQGMGLRFNLASKKYLHECLRVQFGELPDALEGCDFALGAGMVLGAPSVAQHLGIPYRLILYCPALLPAPEHAPAFFPFESAAPWIKRLLWALTQGPFDAWLRRALNRERQRLGLTPLRRALPHLLSERPILCSDAALGPLPACWRGRADTLPYALADPSSRHLPEKLEGFLRAGAPPVFFGFGSMPDPNPGWTTQVVLDTVEALGCRALVSRGWAGLGNRALPSDVAVVEDVPHALLFPRVAGVVHHGGAGTTSTAARAGVPQFAVPHVLDQFFWGHRIHQLGLGPPPLRRSRLAVDPLAERVRALLEAEFLADSAARFGSDLKSSLDQENTDFEALLGFPEASST